VFQCQHRVIARDAEVIRVAYHDDADIVGVRFGDSQAHGLRGGNLPHTIVSIDQRRACALALDGGRGCRVKHAGVNERDVLRQAGHPVALDSPRVAGGEHACGDRSALCGHARAAQDGGRIAVEVVLVDQEVGVSHVALPWWRQSYC